MGFAGAGAGDVEEPVEEPEEVAHWEFVGVITTLVFGPVSTKLGVVPLQVVATFSVFEKVMLDEARKVKVPPDGTVTVIVEVPTVREVASEPESAVTVVKLSQLPESVVFAEKVISAANTAAGNIRKKYKKSTRLNGLMYFIFLI